MPSSSIYVFPHEAPDDRYDTAAAGGLLAYDGPGRLFAVVPPGREGIWRRITKWSNRPVCQLEGAAIVRVRGGRLDERPTAAAIAEAAAALPDNAIVYVEAGLATDDAGDAVPFYPPGVAFTATLLARYADAASITFWTDTPGVPSAPPRFIPDAFTLRHLSYREASEIVYPNTGFLHPRTMVPLFEQQIPLFIRSCFDPGEPGTRVDHTTGNTQGVAKAVTAIEGAGLVVIEGAGMMGIPGIAARALGALAEASINIAMLSQASTEQSIGIIVRQGDLQAALEAARRGLAEEIERSEVQRIYALPNLGVVTVVDDNMRYRPGLTGRMFSTLGRAGINVLTMAEGASETNISAVVEETDLKRAVQALHEAFALGRQRAHVFLFGAGTVGGMLLEMLGRQAEPLLEQLNLHLQLVGIANSKGIVWNVDGIDFDKGLAELARASVHLDQQAIIRHLINSRLDRLIVIDATASDAVTQIYPVLLEHNIAVVTPNKRANTQSMAFYNRLRKASRDRQVPYLYETTVGAGLPVIGTLRDLVRSGDSVLKIEGVLSGTLSFVFTQLALGRPVADVIQEAHRNGYSEPDPRDDLSGEDVARKLLILAREMGISVEREDVEVESLVPPALASVSIADFWAGLAEGFAPLQVRAEAAFAAGTRLRHVASIEGDRLRVSIQAVGPESPLYFLAGTDNLVAFTTARYLRNPLVVRGPGAGPEVTAGGILADVIRAAELVT
ncbi:MAG: ACT domain-containing protein [Rhodothermales bacterium]|nr:ACT domain-containing protein [Rhodothermales bacterium]